MKCAARVALGVAGGYFLGRTKKMKLALMLAGTVAGREAGGPAALLGQGPGALLEQGMKILGASPEMSRVVDGVRGRLLEAGKDAALAVAARQVESLTDRLAGRLESSLDNLAERGRPSPNSSQAEEDRADDNFDDVASDDKDVDDEGSDDEGSDDEGSDDDVADDYEDRRKYDEPSDEHDEPTYDDEQADSESVRNRRGEAVAAARSGRKG
jgi:hypothetical protein